MTSRFRWYSEVSQVWKDLKETQGTEAQFIASLKGSRRDGTIQGTDGQDGEDGQDGTDGSDGKTLLSVHGKILEMMVTEAFL